MIIKGNTVGTPMPRTNYEQTDKNKADYLKGKDVLDESIRKAKEAGDNAKTAAKNAQTAADNAQTAAENAQTSADNAQTSADNALAKTGGAMSGGVDMSGNKVYNIGDPSEDGDAANKKYVDAKHKTFTATLTVNDWVGTEAPYTQTIGIEGILEADKPHITPVYANDLTTKQAQKEAWDMVCEAKTAAGSIIFTCFEDKPTTAVPVEIEVNR